MAASKKLEPCDGGFISRLSSMGMYALVAGGIWMDLLVKAEDYNKSSILLTVASGERRVLDINGMTAFIFVWTRRATGGRFILKKNGDVCQRERMFPQIAR